MSAIFPGAVPTQAQMWTAVNGIATTLNGDIDSIVVVINVIDTTSFPATGYITIDSEVIKYTGKTGTSFTGCTRGSDGTSAAPHSSTATVSAFAVADHHNKHSEEITAIATLIGSNGQDLDLSGRTSGFGIKMTSEDGAHVWRFLVDADGAWIGRMIS